MKIPLETPWQNGPDRSEDDMLMLEPGCECTQDALDGEAPMCEFCFKQGALEAGIPLSVVEGKTKLTDHFSEDYINHKCNRIPRDPELDRWIRNGATQEYIEAQLKKRGPR